MQKTTRPALSLVLTLVLTFGLVTSVTIGCNRIDKDTVVRKVGETFRRLEDYQGTAVKTISVTGFDETMEVKQYFRKPDYHRIEIVSPSEIAGQMTLYDGDTLLFYSPFDKEVTTFPSPSPELTKGDRSDLATAFSEIIMTVENVRVVGREKLGDRTAIVLETRAAAAKKKTTSSTGPPSVPAATTPKTQPSPPAPAASQAPQEGIITRQRIWVDNAIWFPLKVESYDQNGKMVASILYKEIRLNTGLSLEIFQFTPPPDTKVVQADWSIQETTVEEAKQMVAFQLLEPSYLPSDIHLRSVNRSGSADGASIIFDYGNGKGVSVALTESALTPGAPSLAGNRRTDYNGRTYEVIQSEDYSILYWSATGVAFDLTGNLSLEEMLKVADSIR